MENIAVLGECLELMILECFSYINGSVILLLPAKLLSAGCIPLPPPALCATRPSIRRGQEVTAALSTASIPMGQPVLGTPVQALSAPSSLKQSWELL